MELCGSKLTYGDGSNLALIVSVCAIFKMWNPDIVVNECQLFIRVTVHQKLRFQLDPLGMAANFCPSFGRHVEHNSLSIA